MNTVPLQHTHSHTLTLKAHQASVCRWVSVNSTLMLHISKKMVTDMPSISVNVNVNSNNVNNTGINNVNISVDTIDACNRKRLGFCK